MGQKTWTSQENHTAWPGSWSNYFASIFMHLYKNLLQWPAIHLQPLALALRGIVPLASEPAAIFQKLSCPQTICCAIGRLWFLFKTYEKNGHTGPGSIQCRTMVWTTCPECSANAPPGPWPECAAQAWALVDAASPCTGLRSFCHSAIWQVLFHSNGSFSADRKGWQTTERYIRISSNLIRLLYLYITNITMCMYTYNIYMYNYIYIYNIQNIYIYIYNLYMGLSLCV